MASVGEEHVVIVGAGLVGCLLGVFLRRRGLQVTMYERWPDIRTAEVKGGRSINLVITKRGLRALEEVGLESEVLKICVPVCGRTMHSKDGGLKFQPYGRETEWNNSISRLELNKCLLNAAENSGVAVYFEHKLESADISNNLVTLTFKNADQTVVTTTCSRVFGADGGGSVTRRVLNQCGLLKQAVEDLLSFGYKEIIFPPTTTGEYPMQHDSLHIWPRGAHMLMGLADLGHSFTGTMYLPNEGHDESFAELNTEEKVLSFFRRHYADAIDLAGGEEAVVRQFLDNPVGLLGTVRSAPWNHSDRILLIGDAAHAIVPFFGQGCNCGFEDCLVLDRLISVHQSDSTIDWLAVFEEFSTHRKVDADAIADLALDNFVEMRDRVGDAGFLLRKAVEHRIEEHIPHKFRSRYALVVYSAVPYHLCKKAGEVQSGILDVLCEGLASADQLDLARAEALVEERFRPFCEEHHIDLNF